MLNLIRNENQYSTIKENYRFDHPDDSAPPSWKPSLGGRIMVAFFTALNRIIPWHRLPRYLGIANLAAIRIALRQKNLFHPMLETEEMEADDDHVVPPLKSFAARTSKGNYNDIGCPAMGAKGRRFGRNVPPHEAHPEVPSMMMSPNPRLISRELMARRDFIPATGLNMLAAAWIQFQIHDWFSHGENETTNPFQVPLAEGDDWYSHPVMSVQRTARDARNEEERRLRLPPTYRSTETHWWDSSSIYGSGAELTHSLRDGMRGRLRLDESGLPMLLGEAVPHTGFNSNWWIGLELLHTLFAQEHNAICAALRSEYPKWQDEKLFQTARLINSALIAKIHTVEWTTAILSHPTMKLAMEANWWGLLGRRRRGAFTFNGNETLYGIPGSATEHHGTPYSLTEEFVSVYRMHQLIPDAITFRKLDGRLLKRLDMRELIEDKSHRLMTDRSTEIFGEPVNMADMLYSFGVEHPGALRLHNFPNFLRDHTLPDGNRIDLATIDILRDRERGIPRYNRMRRLLGLKPAKHYRDITDDPALASELRSIYGDNIERVDLQVGMMAEKLIDGFGFSETAFRIFILMASRRLKSDRFLTTDYSPRLYTQLGMDWIANNDMSSILLRHFPELTPQLMRCENAFKPWTDIRMT